MERVPLDGAVPASIEVPGYVVGGLLGAGGFGEVFEARHAVLGREVAIKVLRAACSTDPTAVARFVAEARAVDQISHPNIVQVFDFGSLPDGRQYCVMERIHGTTLRDVLHARGWLPIAEALPILRGIAAAVDAAHAAGIAHRDLKPDNVFVLASGGVKLIDFGLAKLTRSDPDAAVTRTGSVFGTPLYMSPEQCRGNAVDLRTDCYSFGVLAYHVLVGEPPWIGDALELALHHLHDEPVPPSRRRPEIAPRVDRLVLSLLAKDPAARPTPIAPTIDALAKAEPRRGRVGWLALAGAGAAVALATLGPSSSRATADPKVSHHALPTSETFATMALDDDALIYVRLDGSVWRRGVDDVAPTRIALDDPETIRGISVAHDGRLVVSRVEHDGEWIWLEDPLHARRERIATGSAARLSRDDRQIAFARGGEVYARELGSQREHLVASVGGHIRALAWSPSGRRIAWERAIEANELRLEIVDTRDGSIRPVPHVLALGVGEMPLAFVEDDTIIYCTDSRQIEELDLEHRRAHVIAPLARNAGSCEIQTRGDGRRVIVATSRFEASVGVLSVREPGAGWRRVAAGGIEDFTRDGRVIVAAWPPPSPPRHRTLYAIDTHHPETAAYPLDGGPALPVGTCPGATRVVRRGDEILANVNASRDGALAMQLVRLGDCKVVEDWTIPDLPDWMFPRCGGSVCATVRAERGQLWVWVLRAGEHAGHELARIPLPSPAPIPWPDLAVAPDGQTIAVAVPDAGDEVLVIDAARGGVRTLHAGPWPRTDDIHGRASTVSWAGDGAAIYVAGFTLAHSAITRLALDGAATPMWSEAASYRGTWQRTSADGAWLGANLLDVGFELDVLDR